MPIISNSNNHPVFFIIFLVLLLGIVQSSSSFSSRSLCKLSPTLSPANNNMGKSKSSHGTSPLLSSSSSSNGHADSSIESRIASIRELMQETHASRRNFRLAWRLDQLTRLQTMVNDHWDEMLDALRSDLGKQRTEASFVEMAALTEEVHYLLANVGPFLNQKTRHVPSSAALFPAFSQITPLPRNGPAVLVIGPSNYPISISLMAVAGSLAAGNPTVLKPSELCPASSKVLAKYIPHYFEASALQVVEGSIPETTALLQQPWGLIHFTGSERVGTIVARSAAETLTPVVLELGGKCPCYVDETCPSDIALVAHRIIWSKTLNCGQNCISPDYVLVHKSQVDALVPELKKALEVQYGKNPADSSLGKLVASVHVTRAVELIQEVEERGKSDKSIQLLSGGSKECDAQAGYVAPTLILNPPMDCRVMKEEIFSPILPIVVVEDREEAVKIINNMAGTPLGLYVFTTSESVFQEMTERCRSGTAVRNDLVVQFAGPHLPFGGLGTSGIGSYRGENSLICFSHMLPSVHRVCAPGADVNLLRCGPYVPWKAFVLEKAVPFFPSIPVLTNVKRAAIAALLPVVAIKFVPGADVLATTLRMGLADILRQAANLLSV